MKPTLFTLFLFLSLSLGFYSCTESEKPKQTIEDSTEEQEAPQDTFIFNMDAIYSIHFNKQKAGASLTESRNFLRYRFFPIFKGFCPGTVGFYMRPDRGPRSGSEGLIWVFQNKETRNRYFPEKDFPTQEFEEHRAVLNELFTDSTYFKYFQAGWNASGFSTDYEFVGIKGKVEQEWIKDDVLLVIQPLKLHNGIAPEEFEKFITDSWSSNENTKGAKSIKAILKSIRGYRENDYIQLWAFENIQARNEVFPYEGKPSDKDKDAEDQRLGAQLKTYVSSLEPSLEEHYEIIY